MATNPMDLSGRRVLVTGASSGIGRETAILLSQLNARTVLVGRSFEMLQQTLQSLEGHGHSAVCFDLAAVEEIPRWLKSLAEQSGSPLHGLVHCAGIHGTVPLRILSPKTLDDMMRINVSASVMLAKALCQKGCSTQGSALVLLSSVAGLVGQPGTAAYSASKAALIGLARSLAMEMATNGIRVNCVVPGMVKTEMMERLAQSLTSEQMAAIERRHPLGFGTARDIANAVAYLLADTGRWITGTSLVVDGGYTAH